MSGVWLISENIQCLEEALQEQTDPLCKLGIKRKLDKQQAVHWANEVKRYRAHLKERISADRQTAITRYNNLMNRFGNEAKEQSAAMKRVKEKHDLWYKTVKKPMEEARKIKTDLRNEKANLLKRMTTLAEEGYTSGGTQSREAMTEIQNLRGRLQEINNELYASEIRGAAEHEEKKLEQKKGPVKSKPQPKGKKKIVRTGTYNGRKVVQYEDGSIDYVS